MMIDISRDASLALIEIPHMHIARTHTHTHTITDCSRGPEILKRDWDLSVHALTFWNCVSEARGLMRTIRHTGGRQCSKTHTDWYRVRSIQARSIQASNQDGTVARATAETRSCLSHIERHMIGSYWESMTEEIPNKCVFSTIVSQHTVS